MAHARPATASTAPPLLNATSIRLLTTITRASYRYSASGAACPSRPAMFSTTTVRPQPQYPTAPAPPREVMGVPEYRGTPTRCLILQMPSYASSKAIFHGVRRILNYVKIIHMSYSGPWMGYPAIAAATQLKAREGDPAVLVVCRSDATQTASKGSKVLCPLTDNTSRTPALSKAPTPAHAPRAVTWAHVPQPQQLLPLVLHARFPVISRRSVRCSTVDSPAHPYIRDLPHQHRHGPYLLQPKP